MWKSQRYARKSLRCSRTRTPQRSSGGEGWFSCQQLSILHPSWSRPARASAWPHGPLFPAFGRSSPLAPRPWPGQAALGLFRRHRQPKLPPQSLNVTSPHLPTLLLEQSCDLRISQLRMLIGFPAQSSLQLYLPGTRFFRPIRVGATIQPKIPAGRSCRTSIPGYKLLCHLSLVSGAYTFFQVPPLTALYRASRRPASAWAGCSPVGAPWVAWPDWAQAFPTLASTGGSSARWSASLGIHPVSSDHCSALPVGCEFWLLLCIVFLSFSGPFLGAQTNSSNGPV